MISSWYLWFQSSKINWGPKFGPFRPKFGPKLGFWPIFRDCFIFAHFAYDDRHAWHLTSNGDLDCIKSISALNPRYFA